ncbi:MtrAB system histidine kinase MtrB [Nocardioides cavernaquae]|uniref:MtrAB system histidine kinase MtrB n=1 Tax=Nocardioides cavernaquae TaxID=2321396 RepID=UPI001EE58C47|nr:MtrAB system histidine kinase MtrB [Nocardioides cavernaquae]
MPHGSGRNLSAALRRGLTFWRRSIQARLVVSTVLLGTVVISGMGWFLLRQTEQGLVDARVRSAIAEAANETVEAEKRLASVPGTDADAAQQIALLFEPIVERGTSRGFGVVLVGPITEGPDASEGGTRTSPGLDTAGVPESLRDHFADANRTAWTFTRVHQRLGEGEVDTAGVAVGHLVHLPADRGRYALYFLFPMDQEEETLALVTRALLTAGVLLLVLVAGLTWLVTRQVVTPIRLARRVAERLAAGQLEERLRVRGEDDIARLAQSFNQMAANLQRQIRQLEELSRVQRRFTSDVSHELRTPLTTVRMAGDVLHDARGDFDPVTARAAELLQTELDRFEGLLSDLLEISRFDAGAAVLDVDDVNLVDLAHRIVDMTRPLAEQRGTEVRVLATNAPVLAEADHRRVERILRNLVTNAIDHAESSGVVVYVAGNEHAASVAVRDHGIGLAAGESALVFNRFWRADPARARTSGGTGLGLAISLEDTHLHGGWLQAWGQPGKGAQFRLTLPRHAGGMLRQSPLPLVPTDVSATPAGREQS